MGSCFGVKPKDSLPTPISQRFSPMFSSKSVMVSGFKLKYMIHFELTFV